MSIPQSLASTPVDPDETRALKALEAGEATAFQQKLALAVIIKKFSRSYDVGFVPGAPDETAFLAGRMYVGQLINKHLKLPMDQLHESERVTHDD